MGPHVRKGDLGRLLHDFTQLAGDGQTRFAVGCRRLDEQHVAADTRDSQTRCHARL